MPKVSVIIPVYNRAELIAQAIASVLRQTFQDFELLAVDDGSRDNTWETLQRYGPPVWALRQEHRGVSAARNLAIQNASGEYLAFLDSDDLWLPQKLARQVQYLDQHPEVALAHCDGWVIEGREVPAAPAALPTYYSNRPPPHGPEAPARLMSTPIITSHLLARTEAVKRLGGFAEDLTIHEDADLILRFLEAGETIGYLPEPLVIKRDLPDGLGRNQLAYILDSIKVQKRSFCRSTVLHPLLIPTLIRSHRLAGWTLYQTSNRLGFIRHCLAAWRIRPRSIRSPLALLAGLLPRRWGLAYLTRLWKIKNRLK